MLKLKQYTDGYKALNTVAHIKKGAVVGVENGLAVIASGCTGVSADGVDRSSQEELLACVKLEYSDFVIEDGCSLTVDSDGCVTVGVKDWEVTEEADSDESVWY